jgi:hypothetical protein
MLRFIPAVAVLPDLWLHVEFALLIATALLWIAIVVGWFMMRDAEGGVTQKRTEPIKKKPRHEEAEQVPDRRR